MNLPRAAGPAALLALLLCSGCAMLAPTQENPGGTASAAAPAGPNASPGSAPGSAPETSTQTIGIQVEIDAPEALKTLLQRHLDLVRLGRLAREEVDDSEWSRLIDATPSQVKALLETEGYFRPEMTLERTPGLAADQPDIVRLRVTPGAQARVSRVTLEAQGELQSAADAGDAQAQAAMNDLRSSWELAPGKAFRNAAWSDAKFNALARLRAAGYANATWSGTGPIAPSWCNPS